jgi:TolB protein
MSRTRPERLRDSLHDLADGVEPADLYDRAVRRSGRIARREAAIGTGAALLVLGVLATGLWRLPGGSTRQSPAVLRPAVSLSATTSPPEQAGAARRTPAPTAEATATADTEPATTETGASPSPRPPSRQRLVEPPAEPRSRVLADLPGQVFYQKAGDQPDVLRLRPADGQTDLVPADVPAPVVISPDGTRKLVAATAVLDTVTGELVALPVSGEVLSATFDARGYLLVRTLRAGIIRLSLVAPDNTLVVQADEPAEVHDLDLIAYTG